MYELTVQRTFSAAHHLRDYEGPCSRMHGHNYRMEITVAGPQPLQNGMLLDFGQLKAICDEVLDELDHRCLNDLPAFAEQNVTSENVAAHVYRQIADKLPFPGIKIARVRLWESDTSYVTYWEQ
jgi:6-pyruvoyltetrahydropterin/6-carboxytetrahydropterin synthase